MRQTPSQRANIERAARARSERTHCEAGHEYTPENTYWKPTRKGKGVHRQCRVCQATYSKNACNRAIVNGR